MAQKDILGMNAALKYIESVLGTIDKADDSTTVEHIRSAFKEQFKCELPILLSQHFGIVRLIPLMYMVQERFLEDTEDGKTIKAIRNAFAHNSFSFDEDGYNFLPNRPNGKIVKISYEAFVSFLWRIESEFYKNSSGT